MSVTQQQVLDALGKVASPRGVALTNANVLSEIIVTDGKVFFSINVDAAEARAWESVRAAGRGRGARHSRRHRRDDRADGRAQAGSPRPRRRRLRSASARRAAGLGAPAAARRGLADVEAGGDPRRRRHHRGGVRQGRRRQVDHGAQSGARLRDLGLRVGVLDADIYGPSMPKLTGIREKPQTQRRQQDDADRALRPARSCRSASWSRKRPPMIWRGPMVMSAITQMLRDVEWGTLDVLVVDMPPGTGDAQLTLAQQVPLKGAVIVSTPQDLALIDARRGARHVQARQCAGARHRREHELLPVPALRHALRHLRPWRRAARGRAARRAVPRRGAAAHDDPRQRPTPARRWWRREPDGPHAAIYRAIAAKVREQLQGVDDRPRALKIVIAGSETFV